MGENGKVIRHVLTVKYETPVEYSGGSVQKTSGMWVCSLGKKSKLERNWKKYSKYNKQKKIVYRNSVEYLVRHYCDRSYKRNIKISYYSNITYLSPKPSFPIAPVSLFLTL